MKNKIKIDGWEISIEEEDAIFLSFGNYSASLACAEMEGVATDSKERTLPVPINVIDAAIKLDESNF